MKYTAARTRFGATLQLDDIRLDADSPHIDRSVVRCTLSAWNGTLLYRDRANLTSGQARQKTLAGLAAKGVEIAEDALVALDQACRTPPPNDPEPTRGDGGTHF